MNHNPDPRNIGKHLRLQPTGKMSQFGTPIYRSGNTEIYQSQPDASGNRITFQHSILPREAKRVGDYIIDPYNGTRKYDAEYERLKREDPERVKIYEAIGAPLKPKPKNNEEQVEAKHYEMQNKAEFSFPDNLSAEERDTAFNVASQLGINPESLLNQISKDKAEKEALLRQAYRNHPWDESKHPRDNIGKFTDRNGGSSSSSSSPSSSGNSKTGPSPDKTKQTMTDAEVRQRVVEIFKSHGPSQNMLDLQKGSERIKYSPSMMVADQSGRTIPAYRVYRSDQKLTEQEKIAVKDGTFARKMSLKEIQQKIILRDPRSHEPLPQEAADYVLSMTDPLPTRAKLDGEDKNDNKGHLQKVRLTVPEAITQKMCLGASTECAGVVQGLFPFMGRTRTWKGEMKVMDNLDYIPLGMPIATFTEAGKDGKYGNKHDIHKHTAIFLGKGVNESKKGFWVLDQWNGQPLHIRFIDADDSKKSWSNNANAYYVITVPKKERK